MGLLSGDALKNIFGTAFSGIYEDGFLIQVEKVRQPNGTLRDEEVARHPIKVQLDRVTEAMTRANGYSATDQRAIVLRKGLSVEDITSDFRLEARGSTWSLYEVATDPARSHFEARAALVKP